MNTQLPDVAGDPDSYYQAHQKIYPREARGRFASLRQLAVIALLGLFYGVCWLDWNGRQAVLFDLPARKFYIFGLTMWPQDFIFLTWLLVIAALSLFFFTAVLGRVWCGYACPQTVWTEAFIWMEQWTEGNRAQRIKLDAAPWGANKIGRKLAKHSLWIGFALWTGFTFVGYFSPVRQLGSHVVNLALGGWETFWILFYSFATWGNAGFLREQVCKYMCPYARFQSAMFDRDTLIVTYDGERGEPRGARRKGEDPRAKGLGDCTDCTLCVQVCPTGIDIRKGLQYECIACAACIDACDTVMDKVGYPRGLVRYTTQHALDHAQTHVVRPRVIVYGSLLTLLIIGFFVTLALRKPVALDVLHDRNSLYRELDDGSYENVYLLKIMNKDDRAHRFTVSVQGDGPPTIDPDSRSFVVPSGEVYNAPVRIREMAHHDDGEHDSPRPREHSGHLHFSIVADDDPNLSAHAEGRFFRGKDRHTDMNTQVRRQHSPIFWVMIGIPAIAVVASFTTLFLAIRGGEPELPASYHWEGAALDQDLQRLQKAAQIGIRAQLRFEPNGRISLRPEFADPIYLPPETLTLQLSHATLPGNDRTLTLQRDGTAWSVKSDRLPAGHWLLELTDGHTWLLRSEFSAPVGSLELSGLRANTK